MTSKLPIHLPRINLKHNISRDIILECIPSVRKSISQRDRGMAISEGGRHNLFAIYCYMKLPHGKSNSPGEERDDEEEDYILSA